MVLVHTAAVAFPVHIRQADYDQGQADYDMGRADYDQGLMAQVLDRPQHYVSVLTNRKWEGSKCLT